MVEAPSCVDSSDHAVDVSSRVPRGLIRINADSIDLKRYAIATTNPIINILATIRMTRSTHVVVHKLGGREMQITIKGELTLAELRQALYEKINELENEFAVSYSKGATLYVNPTDREGEVVFPRGKDGRIVNKMLSNGPYKSAADQFKI